MKKIALIPAYKPSYTLNDVVTALRKRFFEVVVVNDGSGHAYDGIFEITSAYARVISHKVNRGKGEALKTGLSYIKEHYKPPFTVVTADCDGQHRVEDIVKVSEVSAAHPDSLVLGKRVLSDTAPLKSRLGNGTTRVFYFLTTGRRIYETQTGLRGFSDRLIERYRALPGSRYEYEMDMMLISSELDIIETPIETVYINNNADSHFRPFKDTLTLWGEYFRYKIPSLIAAGIDFLAFFLATALSGTFLIPNLCVRTGSFILKYILCRTIPFSEKPKPMRFLLTSAVILLLDTALIWGLSSLGVNLYLSKLISGFLMIGVSIGMRILLVKDKESPR